MPLVYDTGGIFIQLMRKTCGRRLCIHQLEEVIDRSCVCAFPVPQAKKNGTSPGIATGITSEDERRRS